MVIPLAIIQVLARWSLDVIARHVAEVPLSSISELHRQSVCSRGFPEIVSAARVSAAAARQEFHGMTASFREALSSELQSAAQASLGSTAGGAGWFLPFVIHLGRSRIGH